MTIIAAADGSALGNPGPMGWAWYIDDESWAAGGSPHGTNNQGELTAVLELLRATAGEDEALHIECDSRYVIDSVTKWMPGWKRKGWRKADGKPVLNREILEALDHELAGRTVTFEWVKGHAGHPRNEAADELANGAAQAYQRGSDVARGPGFRGTIPDADPITPVTTGAMSNLRGASITPGSAAQPSNAPRTPDTEAQPAGAPDTGAQPAGAPDTAARSRTTVPTTAAPTLFDDLFAEQPADEPAEVELRVRLDPATHERLVARAAAAGVSPEAFLRGLV